MKKVVLLLSVPLIFSCNKKDAKAPLRDTPLQGLWKMTDQFIGNGDGTETRTTITYNIFYRYTATDSLYITDPAVTQPHKMFNVTDSTYFMEANPKKYNYHITGNNMVLTNACDEGCRWMFIKVA